VPAEATILRSVFDLMISHAKEVNPEECCGLISSEGLGFVGSVIYKLKNISERPLTAYEAAPEELFDAQRRMRVERQSLYAIYHSHPRAQQALPSETDVRLAFYPEAVYLIIGLGGTVPVVSAFSIKGETGGWQAMELLVLEKDVIAGEPRALKIR
jgi:proteasome lid subunit RPN8/RPN11